ncbi:hypothetical protein [Thermobifida cellulosilytica]|uniref:Uncharacterized protein n=1 Tax=Thermobifida cellulosilytica TB100 TaxID=665004 RepID=A0A147KKW3_THECS|nr:hypothetical protein [Thermobifida cellulosilytica]KUP97965.1 hypothetical protein AC529_04100 [Thermobifida cellulosilytica TB100]
MLCHCGEPVSVSYDHYPSPFCGNCSLVSASRDSASSSSGGAVWLMLYGALGLGLAVLLAFELLTGW